MRVLLAIDGSPFSDAAITEVATRPWPTGTLVQVLTVIHSAVPMAIDPGFVIAAIHVDQVEGQRQLASALVDAAAERIRRGAPDVTVTTRVMAGPPKDVIVDEARSWDAGLIVVGSHGYGRFQRMLLGSVAGAVVANAPCSVQVVRAKHLVHETDTESAA